jgi:hypothetical protein
MIDWRGVGTVIRKRGQQTLDGYGRRHLLRFEGRDLGYGVVDIPLDYMRRAFTTGWDPEVFLARWEVIERLSPEERYHLFEEHAAACREPEKNGRPVKVAARQAATLACYFYDAWRNENRQLAINDYGHRSEMRDLAARAVVEDMFAWMLGSKKDAWRLAPAKNADRFYHIVRELMDKPAKRRDPSVDRYGDEVDILCTEDGWKSKLPPKRPRRK